MAETEGSKGARAPTLTEVSAIGAGVLYTVGFVVANVHYARYELVRFEFLRGRYAAAALLFATAAVIPSYSGWRVGQDFRFNEIKQHQSGVPTSKSKRALQVRAGLMLLLGSLISFVPAAVLLQLASVDNISPLGVIVFAFIMELPFATLGSIAWKIRVSGYPVRNYITGPRPGFVLFLIIIAAAWFGRQLYPYISPAYGGGAAAIGHIALKPDSIPAGLRAALNQPVAIIDRDEHLIDLVACTDSATSTISSVSLSAENVRAVTLSGLVAVPEAAAHLCTSLQRLHP